MLIITENQNLGVLTVDHRNTGLAKASFETPFMEVPTYTCSHCQRVVVMNRDRVRPRYTCRGCSHLICDPCASAREAGAKCKTFTQMVDEILEAAERQEPAAVILS